MNEIRILQMPQRSDEWFELKKGYFTASEVGKWATVPWSKATKAQVKSRLDLVCSKLSFLTGAANLPTKEEKSVYALERGLDLEELALEALAEETGVEWEQVGLVHRKMSRAACSPDAVSISSDGGRIERLAQIKCPLGKKHLRTLYDGEIPQEYLPQMHWEMAVTGADHNIYFSFNPHMPSFRCILCRDETTEIVEENIEHLHELFYAVSQKIRPQWDRWQKDHERKTIA